MKKYLLVSLAFACISASAQTKFTTSDGLTYLVTSAGTVEVNDADSKVTSFEVPAEVTNEGVTYTVTAIGEDAFYWSKATSVTLPESIDSIKYGAFRSSEIASVTIPSKVKYIGDYAFNSTKITSIDIPASVEEIGNSAFFTCRSLTSVTFHEGLKKIGRSAFYKVPVESIVLPESLDSLSGVTFYGCDKLASVTLPSKLQSLADGDFRECTSLASITLPASLKKIGDEAFFKCTSLTSLNIPAGVETLGTSIIASSGVTNLTVDEGNANFVLSGNVLYNKSKTLLYAIPMKGVTEVTADTKCIGINGGAFWGSEIKKVTLPDGFLAIDDYAFCQSALETINFPGSMTYIGEQGFAATNLTEVTLPVNMPYVYDGAFAGCKQLKSVVIPSGVLSIANHAFHDDGNITSLVCLGDKAPVIEDVYEDYDNPFYNIGVTTVVVPKGSHDSYKDAEWGDYFTIDDSGEAVLGYVSTTPADGGTFTEDYESLSFEVSFGEPITILDETPEAFVRVGSNLSGSLILPDDSWHAVKGSDGKTLRVWGSDYDGYTMTFKTEVGQTYYITIPAGVVANAAGEKNAKITIAVTRAGASGIDSAVSSSSDAVETGRYDISGRKIAAAVKGVNIIRMSDGTVRKVLVK